MLNCGCNIEVKDKSESKVLIKLLLINGGMFVFEGTVGYFAESASLMADSIDMLADALVYGISFYAIGRDHQLKHRAAYFSGVTQILLAALVLWDIYQRFIGQSQPISVVIISMGTLAFIANFISFRIIARHKSEEIHMKASYIFSFNDLIINIGVIFGGVLVFLFQSKIPDLIVGCIVVGIVIYGGLKILKEVKLNETELDI